MFAYVRFLNDGHKAVVSTCEIKDFMNNMFDQTQMYWIQWKQDFKHWAHIQIHKYKGQILMLKGIQVSNSYFNVIHSLHHINK